MCRAAELGRIQAAEALLDYGIDPSIPEASGRTSVHLAAKSGNPQMLETIMVRAACGVRKSVALFLTPLSGSCRRTSAIAVSTLEWAAAC